MDTFCNLLPRQHNSYAAKCYDTIDWLPLRFFHFQPNDQRRGERIKKVVKRTLPLDYKGLGWVSFQYQLSDRRE